jgi:hypothetical protein
VRQLESWQRPLARAASSLAGFRSITVDIDPAGDGGSGAIGYIAVMNATTLEAFGIFG